MYAYTILEHAPRVLSLMDRERMSPTAGCCDRTYWAWKFTDFPGARFQEALCVMGFLYSIKLDNNSYFGNENLFEWIELGLKFWAKIQYADGSFDEAYPYERSLAATAFTTFYIGEALEFFGKDLSNDMMSSVRQTMAKSGDWLVQNDETHGFLSNHLAAAAAALLHVYRVTGDEKFNKRSQYFLQKILDHQSTEGWYEEYGGADPGYQTHGSFYLARYWQLTQNQEVAESLERSMVWLAHFIHPDGSLGGEYASRNTQTYYPAAFEMLALRLPAAAWISERMRPSVVNGAAVGLSNIDIYNYFPILNNLVFACLAWEQRGGAKAPPEKPGEPSGLVWYPKAGMAHVRRKRYDAYIGTAKGGVIKVFDRINKVMVYSDCGYIGRLHNGGLISSQYQDQDRPHAVEGDRIEVEGRFHELSRPRMTPMRFLLFRGFSLSLGRWAKFGKWLKRYLVRVLIYQKKPLDMYFKRSIHFGETAIMVNDKISSFGKTGIQELRWEPIFTTIHMGSSKYFIHNELVKPKYFQWDEPMEIDVNQLGPDGVQIMREIKI